MLKVSIIILLTSLCLAQRFRYIDSAGNIIFVDSISEVPPKYRDQVLPPTPTPITDPKLIKKMEREQKKIKPTKAPKPTKKPKATKTPKPLVLPTIAKPLATVLPTKIPPLSEPAPSPFTLPGIVPEHGTESN